MDINTLRGLVTLLLLIAFVGVCFWAFSRKRKKQFDEAARLPFEDEDMNQRTVEEEKEDKNG